MCLKALEEIVMAPIKLTQRVVSDIGDALGVNGGGGAEDTSAADAAAAEAAAAKAAAEAEAARLAKIEQERKAANERALATEAEKKRQIEMAATIKAESDAAATLLADEAAANAGGSTVIVTPETPLPSTVGSTMPTGDEETTIPTIATKDITSPSTTKKFSESLLQRLSKRGGTGRRSLISGSSGGLGFYSRFS